MKSPRSRLAELQAYSTSRATPYIGKCLFQTINSYGLGKINSKLGIMLDAKKVGIMERVWRCMGSEEDCISDLPDVLRL
jgi:hypothetical protein